MFSSNLAWATQRSRGRGGGSQWRGAPTALDGQEKGRIVAQLVAPGAVVAEVPRRQGVAFER